MLILLKKSILFPLNDKEEKYIDFFKKILHLPYFDII